MKILFLDESGDHNLREVDPHPIFVLGGCAIDQTYYQQQFEPTFSKFKSDLFGKKDLILHYADYTRNRKGFEEISDKPFREKFYKELNHVIGAAPFYVIRIRH